MKRQLITLLVISGAGLGCALAQSSDYLTEAKSAYQQMMARMEMEPAGAPDEDFVMMMIPHHQGAIDMAHLELKYGKDPVLIAMAKKIIADQEREIGEMTAWKEKMK